jgi:hypothetical protein
MQGIYDRKGELFAYLEGDRLYTLEGELSGRVEGDFIRDLGGKAIWRIIGDGIFTADAVDDIGYIGAPAPNYLDQ